MYKTALYVDNTACIIGRAGESPPSLTTGMIFHNYVSSVLPNTVSFLNVSMPFYLGVHAVRNIGSTKDSGFPPRRRDILRLSQRRAQAYTSVASYSCCAA